MHVRRDVGGPGRRELPVLGAEKAVRADREDGNGAPGVIGRNQVSVQQQDVARVSAVVGPVGGLPVQ